MEYKYWFKITNEKYLHKPLQHHSGDTSTSTECDPAVSNAPGAALVVHRETFGLWFALIYTQQRDLYQMKSVQARTEISNK